MAELSSADYAFLAILTAEGGEIRNDEMDDKYQVKLVGQPFKRLFGGEYISCEPKHRPYHCFITEAGRAALVADLTVADDHVEGKERRSARESQLWAGMVALFSLLDGSGPPAVAKEKPVTVDLDGRIRAVYDELAAGPGAWVNLTALRGQLPDIPKAELDAALKRMLRDDEVRLEPEPFGHRVGDEERKAAVHVGGEDRHKLAIGQR
jgi:hypothetical protein